MRVKDSRKFGFVSEKRNSEGGLIGLLEFRMLFWKDYGKITVRNTEGPHTQECPTSISIRDKHVDIHTRIIRNRPSHTVSVLNFRRYYGKNNEERREEVSLSVPVLLLLLSTST